MKQAFRIRASLGLAILSAILLSSCGKGSTAAALDADNAAPVNAVDVMINDYEKVTNQYARAARKLKGGDMSVTIPYIQLGKETRTHAAKLQEISAQMTPRQAQRMASISAKVAPYLQN